MAENKSGQQGHGGKAGSKGGSQKSGGASRKSSMTEEEKLSTRGSGRGGSNK